MSTSEKGRGLGRASVELLLDKLWRDVGGVDNPNHLRSIVYNACDEITKALRVGEKIAPDGNVHTVPFPGRKHLESRDCWCEPELVGDYTGEGGCSHYLHREDQ
jgi:hypothetical protein